MSRTFLRGVNSAKLLSSHANVHSSARPHYCPVKGCSRGEGGKGFKRKNEMIRHGLVHDSPGYVCPFCPDREHKYPRPDNLQRYFKTLPVKVMRTDFSRVLIATSGSTIWIKTRTIHSSGTSLPSGLSVETEAVVAVWALDRFIVFVLERAFSGWPHEYMKFLMRIL